MPTLIPTDLRPNRPFASRPAPSAADTPSVVRYDQIERLLAMSDHDLADIGLRRGDIEAYRNGRIKYLSRRAGP